MFHVFHLNVGRQLNLDVCYSAQPVDRLQDELERLTDVPKTDQHLLISGGLVLSPEKCLSSYTSAGSESNPIFLVSRLQESAAAGSRDHQQQNEEQFLPMTQVYGDLERDVCAYCRQPYKLGNAAVGSQLAERLLNASERLADSCGQLVAEQHNIHQGWCSVVANLDDTVDGFHRHIRKLRRKRDWLTHSRSAIGEMLHNLPSYVEMLRRLPLIRPLMEMNPTVAAAAASTSGRWRNVSGGSTSSENSNAPPLLSLLSLTAGPNNGIGADDIDLGAQIEQDMQKVLDGTVPASMEQWEQFTKRRICDKQMREVRGIQQRFAQLNTYMQKICKLRDDQRNFAQCIQTHEMKMRGCNDPAVQGDIYAGIGNFLQEMSKSHKWMLDVTKRFGRAKLELLDNIRRRLEWIIETHEYIHAADTEVFVHRERVNVLLRRLELLKQLRAAPSLYVQCVAEINRRRTLRRQFVEWAKQVASRSSKLHQEETKHRKELASRLEGHFLGVLFQCLEKSFPLFAVEAPEAFDNSLPFIEFEHLEQIRSAVPELSSYLRLSSSLSDVHGLCKTDGAGVLTAGKASFYCSTPPSSLTSDDHQRAGVESPSFFQSIENIPLSSTFGGSLSQKTTSEADLSGNSETQSTKQADDSSSPSEGRGSFRRSAPISIPTHNAYSSCVSLFPRFPSSVSSCGSGSLPQAERFFIAAHGSDPSSTLHHPYDIASYDNVDSIGRSFDLHPLSPDFISVSPLPGELHDSLFGLVESPSSSSSVKLEDDSATTATVKQSYLLRELNSTTTELAKTKAELTTVKQQLTQWTTAGSQVNAALRSYRQCFDFALTDVRCAVSDLSAWIDEQAMLLRSVCARIASKTAHERALNANSCAKPPCVDKAVGDCQACSAEKDSPLLVDESDDSFWRPLATSNDVESMKQLHRLRSTELHLLQQQLFEQRADNDCRARTTTPDGGVSLDNDDSLELVSNVRCCIETLVEHVAASLPVAVSRYGSGSQTEFDYRVSVVTIEPGDTVLVIYEPTLEAFAIFCLPKTSYFLTESSIRKLGLRKDSSAEQQYKWTFGRVVKKQLCQIKKATNRYKFPIGTKFYRVHVEPIIGANAH